MRERKKMRLEGFDYAAPGAYFITTCIRNRLPLFSEIHNGRMWNSLWGTIVHDQWLWLHDQYDYLVLDEFVLMPNHFHAVLVLAPYESIMNIGTGFDHTQRKIKPVSELIGAFKTTSSKFIHQSGLPDFRWQTSFFDHIIRNERELERIRNYIVGNPQCWESDIERTESDPEEIQRYYDDIFKDE